jgi:hypothetical protein
MKKRAIVSFANSKANYVKSLARLSDSLRNNFDGDFISYINEKSLNIPSHDQSNYGFKIAAMDKCIEMGYRYIIWLDSSCFAIANVEPLFEFLEQDGILMQDSGHKLGTWTNDRTLDYFGITRDEAMEMPMFGNAGLLGIDYGSKIGYEFYKRYSQSQYDGMFNGEWTNDAFTESKDIRCKGHRHDNSCGSAIANIMCITDLYKSGDEVLQYAGVYDKVLNDSIIIKAQGI